MIPGLVACYYSSASIGIPYDEDWYYSNMGESCSNLKTLDLEDKYDVKELKHTWRPEAVRAQRRARRKRRTSLS